MILLFSTWLSPILYNVKLVEEALGPIGLVIYNLNPVTGAVGLLHYGVWAPTTAQTPEIMALMGSDVLRFGLIALMVSLILLVIGQLVFSRLEKSFAQNL